jgi:transcriptional regulator with XRE-family HTH domain
MSSTIVDSVGRPLASPYNEAQHALATEEAVPKRAPRDCGSETFGKRLARLRKDAGFTQAELSEEIGISRRMLAYYEGQTEHPPATLLPLLARTLKVSIDALLGAEPPEGSARPADTRLWRRFKEIEQLPARERRELIKVLDVYLERERLKKASGFSR